jgi:hypothetical protein
VELCNTQILNHVVTWLAHVNSQVLPALHRTISLVTYLPNLILQSLDHFSLNLLMKMNDPHLRSQHKYCSFSLLPHKYRHSWAWAWTSPRTWLGPGSTDNVQIWAGFGNGSNYSNKMLNWALEGLFFFLQTKRKSWQTIWTKEAKLLISFCYVNRSINTHIYTLKERCINDTTVKADCK